MASSRVGRFLLGGLVAGLVLAGGFAILVLRSAPSSDGPGADYFASTSQAGDLPVLWPSPPFSFPADNGSTVTPDALKGHVWITDFIFTQCTTACPLITARMTSLQRRLTDPSLRFVSFSVDPEHDTVEALQNYKKEWSAAESRWLLLRTDPAGLEKVTSGMHVGLSKQADEKNPIIHSNLFLLVDAEGQVRGAYDSGDSSAMARLRSDAVRLLGHHELTSDGLASNDGRVLFESLHCAACHQDPKVAPALGGLIGREVAFEDGGKLTADAAYVNESLVAPGAHVVKGYLPLMPSYESELTDAQLDALVGYVSTLKPQMGGTTASAEPASATLAEDPVCHMKVRVTKDTPHLERDGKTYYFCSETCRETFQGHAAGPHPEPGLMGAGAGAE